MANKEHVERLKGSVQEWNLWRQEQPHLRPDLSRADLTGANLSDADLSRAYLNGASLFESTLYGANLSKAEFPGADLTGAVLSQALLNGAMLNMADLTSADLNNVDLSYADLGGAYLGSVNLSMANLTRAKLTETNLTRANLKGTTFIETNLSETILKGANLTGANLTNTCFYHTTFAWVDLSSVKGLETAIHQGPSIVDINSVILPRDEATRLHFLRGVGFTEIQIEYLPSLLTPRPIQYYSLFISYAHQDKVIAQQLRRDLCKHDVPCWFAPHDLRPGTPILREIEEAIHLQDKFLLILSEHAVKSAWIEREVDAALHQEIKRGQDVLFPIRLDNAVLESNAGWATRLQHRHIGDFTGWQEEATYQQAFTTLLKHLKVSKPPVR